MSRAQRWFLVVSLSVIAVIDVAVEDYDAAVCALLLALVVKP